MKLSKNNKALIEAYKKGYRVTKEGRVSYKSNVLRQSGKYYYRFGVRCIIDGVREMVNVKVHRLQAYQKYGEIIFVTGVQVRHKNNIPKDNSWGNILIGTQSQNKMDLPKEERIRIATIAASHLKKYDNIEVIDFYNKCKSYKETMKKFNISSKGTLHYILNGKKRKAA